MPSAEGFEKLDLPMPAVEAPKKNVAAKKLEDDTKGKLDELLEKAL